MLLRVFQRLSRFVCDHSVYIDSPTLFPEFQLIYIQVADESSWIYQSVRLWWIYVKSDLFSTNSQCEMLCYAISFFSWIDEK